MFNFRTRKMIKMLNNIVIPTFYSVPGAAFHASQKEYLSPNGKYRAYIVHVRNPRSGRVESEITIKSGKGKTLFQKSYLSKENDEDFFVVKAAWTPDSRFFVYNMSDSCRYQPGSFPTFFISIRKVTWKADPGCFVYAASESCNHRPRHFPSFSVSSCKFEVHSLDEHIGTVINPHFRICAPDIVKILAMGRTIRDHHYFKVSLSDKVKR